MNAFEEFIAQLREFFNIPAVFPKRIGQAYANAAAELERLQAIEAAAREYVAKRLLGKFDTGVPGRGVVAFCNGCTRIGETNDPASIKHADWCLAAALLDRKP
jgi:hypothetical protein